MFWQWKRRTGISNFNYIQRKAPTISHSNFKKAIPKLSCVID